MKPLFSIVVAILVIATNAHPENIEEVKQLPQSKEPIVEGEASEPQAREERCTNCAGTNSLKSTNDILASIKSLPNAEVHTQESFEGCSSEKGCAGLKVKDGKVIEKFGNVQALQAGNAVFEGGVPNGGDPYWWMKQNSPFKTGAGGAGGSFQKVSKSSSSYSSSSNGGAGGVDLAGNPFLNGDFSKLSGAGAGAGFGGAGGNFAGSQFSQSSSSTVKEIDISKNPFLNGGVQAGGFGGQSGFGGASQSSYESNSQSSFGTNSRGGFGGAQGGYGGAQGAQGSFGAGQASQTGFGAGQVSQSGFEAGQASQSGFGAGQISQTGFGAGQASQNGFGAGQASQNGFGAGQASQNGYGSAQGSQNAFGSAQGSQSNFNAYSSGSKFSGNGYTGSSPSPFSASTGANVNLIQNNQKNEYDFQQQQQTQQNIDELFQSTGNVQTQGNSGGDLQQTCAGQGYVCVQKSQCNNGVVNTNGGGLLQANTQKQYCNTRTEICCRIETSSLAGAGNVQGSLGISSGTFQGSNQGSELFSQTGSTQGSQSNYGASTYETGQATNLGFGAGQASGFNSVNRENSGFAAQGNTNQFGANSYGSNKFGSTASGFGSTASGFGSTPSGFGPTVAPTPSRFGSTGFKATSQSNFVETDSFSAGSENNGIFRPGASGAGLKPGIPYLPPVDSSTSGSNVVSTGYSPAFVTTPRPFSTPQPTYLPPVSTKAPEYLPPIDRITGSDSFPQPTYVDGQLILDETLPARPKQPQPPTNNNIPSGCAAALKCTPIEFCTADGVISNTSVVLTRDQQIFRVPLTDCKDLGSGRIGKCCRDPFYTDPWPANQLGKWVPGVFGGDDGKYTTPKTGSVLKTEFIPTEPPRRINTPGQYEKGYREQYTDESTDYQSKTNLYEYERGQRIKIGEGLKIKEGVGKIITTGIAKIVTEGNVYGVREGENTRTDQRGIIEVNRGGINVTQGVKYGIEQQKGQKITQTRVDEITNGFGTRTKTGQFYVTENGEEEVSESIQRVYLPKYTGSGDCGLLNPQKPYGNRKDLEVDFAEIPWQAMVLLQTNRSLLCGGVITRPDVVITSASCVEGLQAKNVLIKGGEWKLGIDDEPLPFQIVQVKHILRHPLYKAGIFRYDAAILVLTENLRLAKNIWPICMPSAKDTLDGYYNGAGECIVTGWGKSVLQSHLLGSVMHSMNVSLLNPGECQSKINQEYPHLLEHYDQESCVCGQPTNPANNICKVDIGSALACTTGDNHFVLRGIYSWDAGCQVGNQLASFYRFDLEWYEWAIGLIESVRFAQFTTTKVITQTSGVKTTYGTGNKGQYTTIGVAKYPIGGQRQTGTVITEFGLKESNTKTGSTNTGQTNIKGFGGVNEKIQTVTTTTGQIGTKGFGFTGETQTGTKTGVNKYINGQTETGTAITESGYGLTKFGIPTGQVDNNGFNIGKVTKTTTTYTNGQVGNKGFDIGQTNTGSTTTGQLGFKGFGGIGEKTQTVTTTTGQIGTKRFGITGETQTGTKTGVNKYINGQTETGTAITESGYGLTKFGIPTGQVDNNGFNIGKVTQTITTYTNGQVGNKGFDIGQTNTGSTTTGQLGFKGFGGIGEKTQTVTTTTGQIGTKRFGITGETQTGTKTGVNKYINGQTETGTAITESGYGLTKFGIPTGQVDNNGFNIGKVTKTTTTYTNGQVGNKGFDIGQTNTGSTTTGQLGFKGFGGIGEKTQTVTTTTGQVGFKRFGIGGDSQIGSNIGVNKYINGQTQTGTAITESGYGLTKFGIPTGQIDNNGFNIGKVTKTTTTVTTKQIGNKGFDIGPTNTGSTTTGQLGFKGFGGIGEKTQTVTTTTGQVGFKRFGIGGDSQIGSNIGVNKYINGQTQTGTAITESGYGLKEFGIPTGQVDNNGFNIGKVTKTTTTYTNGQVGNKGFDIGQTNTGSTTTGQLGFKGFGGQTQSTDFNQFGTTKFGTGATKFTESGGIGTEIKGPISNTYSTTFTEKKYYQTEPKFYTVTTKPEYYYVTTKPIIKTFTTKPIIETFTTKPIVEYFTTKPVIRTFTTKPIIETFTTKPVIRTFVSEPQYVKFDYQTSGSQTNTQVVPPTVSFNPSFSEVVGSKHIHDAKCKCLENAKK